MSNTNPLSTWATKTLRKLSPADKVAFKALDAYVSARKFNRGVVARVIPSGFRGSVCDADSKIETLAGTIASFTTDDVARDAISIVHMKHR